VGGGALTVHNTTYSNDDAKFSISIGGSQIEDLPLGDLRYESTSAQTGMSLENGAVVKRMLAQEGSAMLAEPRWFYDGQTGTAVIYLIGFNTTDTTNVLSQTGIGTVKMELDQTKTNSTPYDNTVGQQISVKYSPNTNANYSTAWGNYFTGTLGMKSDGNGVYHFDPTPSTLVVNKYEIIIKSV
jgi:hypothetical protein